MKRRSLLSLTLVLLAGATLLSGRPTLAESDDYIITDLGTLPGKANSWVWQQTINDNGEIAAYANDIADPNAGSTDIPFLWRNGTSTILPGLPGTTSTIPFAINNRGHMAGYSRISDGSPQPVYWEKGQITHLPLLPGDTRGDALMLNNSDQIVGFTRNPGWPGRHATMWTRKNGVFKITRLPGLTGGDAFEQGLGINERGQAVGYSGAVAGTEHAVLWEDGKVKDLGTAGGPTSYAVAINDRGEIGGGTDTAPGVSFPCLWKNGRITLLTVEQGDIGGVVQGINNRGDAVGYSVTDYSDFAATHALLWTRGKMINLQAKIAPDSGWRLILAEGINNRGQITGFGIHNGEYRAFLLTPRHSDSGDDD